MLNLGNNWASEGTVLSVSVYLLVTSAGNLQMVCTAEEPYHVLVGKTAGTLHHQSFEISWSQH